MIQTAIEQKALSGSLYMVHRARDGTCGSPEGKFHRLQSLYDACMGFVQMRLVWIGVLLLAQAAMGATVEDLLRDGHYKRAREAVQAMLAKNPNDAQARA